MLGFRFARDKLAPFSTTTEMLGVVVDTSAKELVKVDNKETRKTDLVAEINKLLESGKMDAESLASLLGRVQYAELRIAGRRGKLALADIRECERGEMVKHGITLDATSRRAFEILLERVSSGKPKTFSTEPDRPVLIFTDGAVETNQNDEVEATIGGVIFVDGVVQAFGCHVDTQVLQEWMSELVHPVGLTELYGVVVAFHLWKPFLQNRRVIIFCDNWTAVDVFIRGSSSLKLWRHLLLALEQSDDDSGNLVWMARVPSPSNIADPPSRGQCMGRDTVFTTIQEMFSNVSHIGKGLVKLVS